MGDQEGPEIELAKVAVRAFDDTSQDAPDGLLPSYPIPGATVSSGGDFVAPPYSYGYVRYSGGGAAACA